MINLKIFQFVVDSKKWGITPQDLIPLEVMDFLVGLPTGKLNILFAPTEPGSLLQYIFQCPKCKGRWIHRETKTAFFAHLKNLKDGKTYYCGDCYKTLPNVSPPPEPDIIDVLLLPSGTQVLYSSLMKCINDVPDSEKRIMQKIRSMKYRDFLDTPYWKAITHHVKQTSSNVCSGCGSTENQLHTHHKTYENHGQEHRHLEDLVCICKRCHEEHHGISLIQINDEFPDPLTDTDLAAFRNTWRKVHQLEVSRN